LTTPTASDRFTDSRPGFSPDGSTVVFMRSTDSAPSALYTVPIFGGPAQKIQPVDCPENLSLTRPDWSWHRRSFEIAFAGNLPAHDGVAAQANIYLLDVVTSACRLVLQGSPEQNQVYSYPSWYGDGVRLAITNYWFQVDETGCSEESDPQPLLLRLDVVRTTLTALTSPASIWPGMSSVAQHPRGGFPAIAFAGERPIAGGRYCQDDNQIWIRTPSGELREADGQQGRSPWWSPSGLLIAFESNRCASSPQDYQIFVQSPRRPELIAPVTPPGLPVQHAKWSPDARKLVFAYQAGDVGAGIAYVDLHPFADLP
jgi:Tol biopolymer transport system component